jgi:hypothetical protein
MFVPLIWYEFTYVIFGFSKRYLGESSPDNRHLYVIQQSTHTLRNLNFLIHESHFYTYKQQNLTCYYFLDQTNNHKYKNKQPCDTIYSLHETSEPEHKIKNQNNCTREKAAIFMTTAEFCNVLNTISVGEWATQ